MTASRLGVSNLAWSPEREAAALDLLVQIGAHGVEVAPTRLAPWPDLTMDRLSAFRRACAARDLAIPSLQAIFFGVKEAALLGDKAGFAAMCTHLHRVGECAEALGASVAVFGAPRNRRRGALSAEAALALAADRLPVLGDIAATHGLTLGMEAVPACYDCDFLQHPAEVAALVERCGHERVRAHVDVACATLAGCDPAEAVRLSNPVHVHVTEPKLVPLTAPGCDHEAAAAALAASGYQGWLVIEMLADPVDELEALRASVAFARRAYGTMAPLQADAGASGFGTR